MVKTVEQLTEDIKDFTVVQHTISANVIGTAMVNALEFKNRGEITHSELVAVYNYLGDLCHAQAAAIVDDTKGEVV